MPRAFRALRHRSGAPGSVGGMAFDAALSDTARIARDLDPALLETIVAPYQTGGDDPRIRIVGGDLDLAGAAVTALALIFYELATNAAKHGALSSPSGAVTIEAIVEDDTVSLIWDERGALVEEVPKKEGFGSKLERLATGQLGGDIEREWQPDGVRIVVTIARERLGTSALI